MTPYGLRPALTLPYALDYELSYVRYIVRILFTTCARNAIRFYARYLASCSHSMICEVFLESTLANTRSLFSQCYLILRTPTWDMRPPLSVA